MARWKLEPAMEKTKWKKGQSGNPNGRPPLTIKRVNDQLKAEGYDTATRQDIEGSYMHLASLPESRLKELWTDRSQPMLIRIISQSLLIGFNRFDIVERVLDRAVGKPTQRNETRVDGSLNTNPPLTDEERKMINLITQNHLWTETTET